MAPSVSRVRLACLGAFKNQKLEQRTVIVKWNAPFLVVVNPIELETFTLRATLLGMTFCEGLGNKVGRRNAPMSDASAT